MSDVHEGDTNARRTPLAGADDTADVPAPAKAPAPPDEPSWHTTELPSPGRALPPGLWLFFLLFAAAGFLGGIGVAAATRPGPPGTVVAQATIGSDGGTLGFGGRGVVRVPDGAVSKPIGLEVRRSVVDERVRVNPPDGPLYVFERNRLVAYTFSPASAVFARPVSIVLPLERTGRNGTAFVVSDLGVVFVPGKVDAKAGTLTIRVADFGFRAGTAGGTS